ncbi:MarR family winged helix-turn-helix transcriptional regulator [Pelosinus propionicus]|uniref:DNA-binding transcriptional regulator, MarR family n=1 Tax=Pelosinus propionicus DSM 13327 TaxID=1123291 RepID=A0A1I4K771_9FIRM|nr:MarR family transcriptional regulator [Pelosinus propionicus]SFL74560.1 DNA-binding transcriptional regulator, MarR family [Pelosinus propionicus DSM 13327]
MLQIFDNICMLFAKAEQKHTQFAKETLSQKKLGITPVQMMVLYTLYKGDGISLSELGKRSYLDSSTLTGLIDRLENSELVYRADSPEDRRAYHIFLTEKAIALKNSLIEVLSLVQAEMLKECTEEEISIFERVLLKIYRNL